jgi:hypothetical protein
VAARHLIERTVAAPAPVVIGRLRAGVAPSWRGSPAAGLVGSVTDNRLQGRLAAARRRFPPVLDVRVEPAGRGSVVSGRVRRSALAGPFLLSLVLLEILLTVVAVLAAQAGAGAVTLLVPAVFLLALVPVVRGLLRVPAQEVARLTEWLDRQLSVDPPAGPGA